MAHHVGSEVMDEAASLRDSDLSHSHEDSESGCTPLTHTCSCCASPILLTSPNELQFPNTIVLFRKWYFYGEGVVSSRFFTGTVFRPPIG